MSGQSGGNQGGSGGQPQAGGPQGGPQAGPQGGPQGGGPPQAGGPPQDDDEDQMEVIAAKIGALAFAIVGLGAFITLAFRNLLADDDAFVFAAGFEDEELFSAAASGADLLPIISAILALGLGIFFYKRSDFDEVLKPTVIAVAAGAALAGILMLVFGVIFEPDGADVDFGDEIVGFLGYVIGSVAVGALVGWVAENDPLELFEVEE